jgi:adenylyltransferase/sulfurtransferase
LIQNEYLRYSRQINLEGFDLKKQKKLNDSKVLVVGAGGLGSPVLLYLASAGIGTIGIADYDKVTISNLNRQIIHNSSDLKSLKVNSAEKKLKLLNPDINIKKHNYKISLANVENTIKEYDLIIDCGDNFPVRYLISDCCYFMKKTLIEGAVNGYDGILMTIIPDETPCYRCIYSYPPQNGTIKDFNNEGILGAFAGIVGSIQALEAIKVLTEIGENISGRIMVIDALRSKFRDVNWKKRDECPLCGRNPSIKNLIEY